MKKILYLFLVFNILKISAQDLHELDTRLLYRFSQSQLEGIASADPNHLEYLNFYVNHSYYFTDIEIVPKQKLEDYTDILEHLSVSSGYEISYPINEDNFNIFMFDVKFFENRRSAYLVGNSNVMVVLRSKKEINTMFNQISH